MQSEELRMAIIESVADAQRYLKEQADKRYIDVGNVASPKMQVCKGS